MRPVVGGVAVSLDVLGPGGDAEPPRCELEADIERELARLRRDQACRVAFGTFDGTWTFDAGVLSVSDTGQLRLGATAELVEASGARAEYVFDVLGARLP